MKRLNSSAGAAALFLGAIVILFGSGALREERENGGMPPPGASGEAEGRRIHAQSSHRCDHSCQHASPRGASRAVANPALLHDFLSAGPGVSVRLEAGDWKWMVEDLERRECGDGRLVVSGRTADGGLLFAVTDGLSWEGRLAWPDHTEAWLLRGDGHETRIERCPLSSIICSFERDGLPVGGLPLISVEGPVLEAAGEDHDLVLEESAPILHSLEGANGVIYLDFDGETVSGTNYNSFFTGGADIVAGAAGFSNAGIQDIWERVAEDFRPFNVNVTTDRAVFDAAAINRRVQIIFTPDNEWYGAAGGVAFVGTFGSAFYDEPAWVFVDQLRYNNAPHPPFAAEAASHEAGHTLGLHHDGDGGSAYYYGHGSGATSWAPIMGAAYNVKVSQWSKGEYPGASNTEDDLAIISGPANGLGYRGDDHPDSPGTAGPMPVITNGGLEVAVTGIIERRSDVDVFEVQVESGELSFTAMNDPADPNLDLKLRLLDAAGGEVAVDDPAGSLDAGLSVVVAGGTYYLEVSGVGSGTTATGYPDYGSLGAYAVVGVLPGPPLTADLVSPPVGSISLPAGTGLVVAGSLSAGTPQWQVIGTPAGGSASFATPGALATDCAFSGEGLYQLRFQASHQGATAEADLWVSVEGPGGSKLHPNRGTGVDLGPDGATYQNCVLLSPLLNDDGVPGTSLAVTWSVLAGQATLSDPDAVQTELTFESPDAVALRLVVDDGEIRTFGEVSVSGRFHQEILVDSTTTAKVHVPAGGSLDAQWRQPGFDDAAWQSGSLGAGFNANPFAPESSLYESLIGEGLDLEAAMHGTASSCYLRAPFELPVADAVLQMVLRMHYDDGFVAYLNGTEVARANAPAGAPAWDSTAAADRSDEAAESAVSFALLIPDGLLRDGTNVLAIHGLNSTSAPADREFVLRPELEALVSSLPFLESVSVVADPGQRGFHDDPDGDGQDNLEEHAAGTDPASAASPPVIEVCAGEGATDVEVRVRLPVSAPADVRYDLQYRHDLGADWSTVTSRSGGGPWSGAQPAVPVADGPNHEVFVFPEARIEKSFWRLRIVRVTLSEAPVIAN